MKKALYLIILLLLILPLILNAEDKPMRYESNTFEIIRGAQKDTIYLTGAVSFYREEGRLSADSALWVKGETIILSGHVFIQDTTYQLEADKVRYDVQNQIAYAEGKEVKITSAKDSLMAIGTNAYYSKDSSIFRMASRPTIYLNYPDSAKLVRVDADRISIDGKDRIGYADGRVVINQNQTESQSGRAILYFDDNILALYDNPSARRKESEIKGDTLLIYSENSYLKRILVEGNAEGDFREPSGADSAIFDISNLKGYQIEFNLNRGDLENIIASGQAYSFYSPGVKDSSNIVKNNVSGDTIKLFIQNEKLTLVEIVGGAEGDYLSGKYKGNDTARVFVEDTISYKSDLINYAMIDSTIIMTGNAAVTNKNLALTASRVKYNISRELVLAYDDSLKRETSLVYIPVVLKDGKEELLGSYLEYSMKTEKGMLRRSKTEYQEGYYRGRELFREHKDIYYVDNGSYTSCNLESPHYHFQSPRMKMIQGDKIIAEPVIFYIEKVPLMIVPYYVFSIKPGRHSGFLPFRLGNFERGAGSISNVGYYWAASEFWDAQASLDYYENYGFNYNGTFRYNVRYQFTGSLLGSYNTDSRFYQYKELKRKRWQIKFNHSHTISPTFSIRADGTFLSDKSYYTDFSTNLDDRLDRNLRSQISLSKQWGSASLSAQALHTVNLDQDSRADELPTASLSFPSRPLFGSPKKKAGEEPKRKWFQSLYFGYSMNLRNSSGSSTVITIGATGDTTRLKSRKEFAVINHNPGLTIAPVSFLRYLRIGPSFRYQETWYKIFKTDQSDTAGIDAGETYRRYAYSASVSAATDLYGTVYPNFWGLEGIRHVLSPSASFSWAPEITRHDKIKAYTGAGGGGAKQRTLSFSLSQLFQAKVKSGEISKNIDLLSVSSSLGYNFEAKDRKFSELTTSAQTSLLRNIRMSASMGHDLYEPNTNKLKWRSPYLTHFSVSTSFSIGGAMGEYGEIDTTELKSAFAGKKTVKESQNWSLSLSHYYSENGRGSYFSKVHSISFSFKVNLTPNLKLTYWQNYDFTRHRTVSRRIEIERDIHCWKGYFYWIPDGSNRGYYFKINVISIPDIKFEKSESGIKGAFL